MARIRCCATTSRQLKGNHLFSFGGAYQRNYDYHSRTDNGEGTNDQISYLNNKSGFVFA